MSNQADRAALFSRAAHEAIGQKRKYTGHPYHWHPREVVSILYSRIKPDLTDDMVCAAYLHDVLEDTHVEEATIRNIFGNKVADIVFELTDISKPDDGNRKRRKAIDRGHIAAASSDAQTIKCADLIDNTSSIVKYDRRFAKTYLEEKSLLLEVMTKAHPVMLEAAKKSLSNALDELSSNT